MCVGGGGTTYFLGVGEKKLYNGSTGDFMQALVANKLKCMESFESKNVFKIALGDYNSLGSQQPISNLFTLKDLEANPS